MAAEISGMFSVMVLVRRVEVLAWAGRTEDAAGTRRTSSKVRASAISMPAPSWLSNFGRVLLGKPLRTFPEHAPKKGAGLLHVSPTGARAPTLPKWLINQSPVCGPGVPAKVRLPFRAVRHEAVQRHPHPTARLYP